MITLGNNMGNDELEGGNHMNKTFLFDMLSTPSVSGDEIALQKKVYEYMKDKADQMITDANGNVISVLNPDSKVKVLLTGHIDEIGLFVSEFTSTGFLKVKNAGGVYTTTYPGHKVRIHTQNGILMGAVANTRDLSTKKDMESSDLTIDLGVSSMEEAKKVVRIGDTITFDTDYCELLGNKLCGRALDNRVGAFVVMEALNRCKEKGCHIGVYSAATVGEETTKRGAYMAASRVNPTMSIAVDVTYATDFPGVTQRGDVALGKGPVICYAPLINRTMNQMLLDCGKKMNLNVQLETETFHTGTDADTVHFTGLGVPVCLVSIPLRYMHNPDETVSYQDIEDCIELLSTFLCSLEEDFELNPFI